MHLKVIPFFTRVTAYHVIPCLWHLTGTKKTLLFHVMGSASPLAYSQWSVGSKIACSVESTSPGAVSSSSGQTLDPWCTRRFGNMQIVPRFQLPLLHVASSMTSSAAFRFYTLGILHLLNCGTTIVINHQLTVGSLNLWVGPQTHINLGTGGSHIYGVPKSISHRIPNRLLPHSKKLCRCEVVSS